MHPAVDAHAVARSVGSAAWNIPWARGTMSGKCIHGFEPADCLICRTLGTGQPATAPAGPQKDRRRGRSVQVPTAPASPPVRPDTIYPPSGTGRPKHSLSRPLIFGVAVLLAVGAAVWILAGVVFTVLHVLELIAIAAGAGWVGYRIGHFNGSRHARSGK